MTYSRPIVIVGAGHAGFQAALFLRQNGYKDPIQLINGEEHLPYQRPPLSKSYLSGNECADTIAFRPGTFFAEKNIEVVSSKAESINPAAQTVSLSTGRLLDYKHLILATGADNRRLESWQSDCDLHYIRDLNEVTSLRRRLGSAQRVVMVGGGFIGLEFAATARALGLEVEVIEREGRLMERAVTAAISRFFEQRHRAAGINFRFGARVDRMTRLDGEMMNVSLSDGSKLITDLAVVGIGTVPNTKLAADAKLVVQNGVLVDKYLRSSDFNISAIGDCAVFSNPYTAGSVRIESVQNAADQARCVAARLTGKITPYESLPWFWSDQGPDKLQIAGLTHGADRTVMRGTPESGSFSVFCYCGQRLLGVESVNRPADHVFARKLLGSGGSIEPDVAADLGLNLKDLIPKTKTG
jgi:3-phenylpropionate/trans-cinnamate dioxygenase ferredoxin reductase subunit